MKQLLLTKRLIAARSGGAKILVAILLMLLPGFSFAQAASAVFGVTFGQPQDNGGECVGKGVCKEDFTYDPVNNVYTTYPNAVTVTFQLAPSNPGVIMMSLSLTELRQKQPDQVANFFDSNGYAFGAPYSLTNAAFTQMSLPPNSQILPSSQFTTQVNGDFLTVSYTYSSSGN